MKTVDTMFVIPRKLQELERERDNGLSVVNIQDPNSVGPGDLDAAYKECTSAFATGPLAILTQETFDATYMVVRSLELLDAGRAAKFATSLSQNLSMLVSSGLEELAADGRDKGDPVVVTHISAIHAYAFFQQKTHESLHARNLDNHKMGANAAGPKKRGAKAKAVADEGTEDGLPALWPAVVERIAKVLTRTLKANLDGILYRSPADKNRLVEVCILTVARAMEDSSIMKQKGALTACLDVAVLSTTRHANAGCLELTAETLFRLVQEHDHGISVAIQASSLAAGQYNSLSLGKALLNKFCEVEPDRYDEVAARDTRPVKRAAELLSGMVKALPAILHASISQLMPYFGCETAVTIRSNLVECMGELMEWYKERGMDEKNSRQLQISRQNAVLTLVSRGNDKGAFVRKAALNTMEKLIERKCWPIEFTVVAARVAVARLDDGPLPAAAALSLLCTLVVNTGTDKLTDSFLVATINKLENELKGMTPDVVGEGQDEPRWEVGALGEEGRQQKPDNLGAGVTPPGRDNEEGILMPTQFDDSLGGAAPAARQDDSGTNGTFGIGMTYSQMRLLIASLKELLELSRTLAAALPEVESLLASDNVDVAERAIQLLTLCSQKQLQGVADSWRRVWHLVFSTSEKVRETVLDAFYNYLLPGASVTGTQQRHRYMINKLIEMVCDLALSDQEALSELMHLAVNGSKPGEAPMLDPQLVRVMVTDQHVAISQATLLEKGGGDDASVARNLARRLSLLCSMVARHAPHLVVQDVEHLVEDLKRSHTVLKDLLIVRNLVLMLRDIAPQLHASAKGRISGGPKYHPASHVPNALAHLLSVLVSSHLPEYGGSWPPAAQAAVAAIYRLHPEPHSLLRPLMQHLAAGLANGRTSATQAARAIFLVGCIAMHQLAFIDLLAKRVRQERAAQEKAAAEKASPDDMNAQLGISQAKEHQLDALQEELEVQMMEGGSLLGMWGKIVSGLCHSPDLLAVHADLASAAMTTLAKFMAIDAKYCDENCPVFFTRLTGGNVKLSPEVRCSMLVALGDLGRRHPNIMEPWTERMFVCLKDENEEVAKTCLRILAHLILSDMTKPKGHMAQVARCLVSPSAAVRDLAIRLFNSLSSKQAKGGGNKVYQYLPEIISMVTRGDPMPEDDFKQMMQRLLGYVKVDKLADKLKERLCERFQNVVCNFRSSAPAAPTSTEAGVMSLSTGDGTGPVPYVNNSSTHNSCSFAEVVREWRSLADCIALMPYSEKGLHICMENMRCYKHALGDNHVYQVFKSIAEHGRRGNRAAELKQEILDFEARLHESHKSLHEEQMQQVTAEMGKDSADANANAHPAEGSSDGIEKQQHAQCDLDAAIQDVMEAESADVKVQHPTNQSPFVPGEGLADGNDGDPVETVGDDPIDSGVEQSEDAGEGPAEEEGGVRGTMQEASDPADGGYELDEGALQEKDDSHAEGQGDDGEDMYDEEEEKEEEEGIGRPACDMDVDYDEGSGKTETSARTPLRPRRHGQHTAAVTPVSTATASPMAITPVLNQFNQAAQHSPDNSMAWSPAPTTAAIPVVVSGPVLQENTQGAFPGFRTKPNPDELEAGAPGPVWPVGAGFETRIKPHPEGTRPGPLGAAMPVCGVMGVRIKLDPGVPRH